MCGSFPTRMCTATSLITSPNDLMKWLIFRVTIDDPDFKPLWLKDESYPVTSETDTLYYLADKYGIDKRLEGSVYEVIDMDNELDVGYDYDGIYPEEYE